MHAPSKKKTDRRVQRSQRALQDALLQLMLEKGYAETTVADIVERANVGRSTFYAHFADKEDLLQQSLQGLKDFLTDETIIPPQRQGTTHPALSFALPMFLHADEQRKLFHSLMRVRSSAPVQEHLQIMLIDLVIEKLSQEQGPSGIVDEQTQEEIRLQAHFIVGAFLGILLDWVVDPNACSAMEIDRKFRHLAVQGAFAFRERDPSETDNHSSTKGAS